MTVNYIKDVSKTFNKTDIYSYLMEHKIKRKSDIPYLPISSPERSEISMHSDVHKLTIVGSGR